MATHVRHDVHGRRNAGRLVKVTFVDGKAATGRVLDSDEESVTLDVGGARQQVAYAEVGKALVQVEFNRPKDDANDNADELGDDEAGEA